MWIPKRLVDKACTTQCRPLQSTLWACRSATPLNRWINNTAAGSSDTGFWLQLQKVNGVSASIKGASKLNLLTSPLTEFVNNTAHSNTVKGLRTYKNGFHPKVKRESNH